MIRLAVLLAAAIACDEGKPNVEGKPTSGGEDGEVDRTRSCPDGTCMPVPEGIRGLAFAMTRDQAKRAVGRLRLRKPVDRTVVSGECRERLRSPGIRTKATTSIGSENAVCELWFLKAAESPDGVAGLALIDCALDARRSRAAHTETVWLLYQSLAKQYGQAHSLSDRLADRGRLKAIWTSDTAELILTAGHRNRRSKIELVNRSARYNQAIEDQVEAVRKRCELEAAARAREKADEEQRLRDRAKSFEKDLRPPLERPQ